MLYGLGRKPGGGGAGVLSWFDLRHLMGMSRKSSVRSDHVLTWSETPCIATSRSSRRRRTCTNREDCCTSHAHGRRRVSILSATCQSRGTVKNTNPRGVTACCISCGRQLNHAFDDWTGHDVGGDDDVFIMPVRRTLSSPWELPDIKPLPGSLTPLGGDDADKEVEFYSPLCIAGSRRLQRGARRLTAPKSMRSAK
jgi:hypothetical protein